RKEVACQLAILGTGELEGYLQGLAKELGIEKDVYFLGWQENPFKFLAKAQLFVLPSVSEGLPLVLLEAMACRLPVIATDCAGSSREIIAPRGVDEFGILIPLIDEGRYAGFDPCAEEERAMADAILRILRDADLRQKFISSGLTRLRDF